MKIKLFALIFTLFITHLFATEIHVPEDYNTIQSAISNAQDGDVIIVNNGTYYENIFFYGKEILLTSNYHLTGNVRDIKTTIINGSSATDNFGTCVSFNNDENQNSILKGFTITGGSGTRFFNSSDNQWFRAGGGLLIDNASPTIMNNIIEDNHCLEGSDVAGAGGGGLRMGFGQPIIKNNIIRNNSGGYAGGMMIARQSTGSIIKNNLISNNSASGSFSGGGGIFVDWQPVTLENCTIVNNHSGDVGGGLISTGTSTIVINCIIYGNTATNGSPQIYKRFGGNATVTYSNIEGGFDGTGSEEGNIDMLPDFVDTSSYFLDTNSPCIDTGNPDSEYNDIENPSSSGNALFPSMGTIRNDMGASGGQDVESILSVHSNTIIKGIDFILSNPYQNEGFKIISDRNTTLKLVVFSFLGEKLVKNKKININQGENIVDLNINTNSILTFFENDNTKIFKLIVLK